MVDDDTPTLVADGLTLKDKKWHKDESGKLVMPVLQSEFLDWLLSDASDRHPDTEIEWCRSKGVARDTARKWKQDRRFREVWERRATEKNISPERIQRVIDVLYQGAVNLGDTGAAKQFLLYAEKLLPPKEIKRDASVMHLTDQELVHEVEGIIAAGFGQ